MKATNGGRTLTTLLLWLCSVSLAVYNIEQLVLTLPQTETESFQQTAYYKTPHYDLTPTPEELKAEYGFTAAMCLLLKDGEAYLEEWIDYHLAMGFSSIYIYDDSPTFELQNWYLHTRNHTKYQRVEILHFDGNQFPHNYHYQRDAYSDCVERFGRNGPKHDYFAFIDIDEFLVLQTDKYKDFMGVIKDYLAPYGGSLVVNWMFVGSANKTVYSPLPVTKRFQYRQPSAHYVIKSFGKTSEYKTHLNPHSIEFHDDVENVERKMRHTTAYPGAPQPDIEDPTWASDYGNHSDVVLLYHYRYTSLKEYIYRRCKRGRVRKAVSHRYCTETGDALQTIGVRDHQLPSPGTVFDDRPWQFLKSHVPKYAMYDEFDDFH
eukprot:scaffold4247_cov66-Cylindrotheca_fusiformis.AAC.16